MTITAPEAVDNYEWLDAIDASPDTSTEHLLAAYRVLGVKTDRTPEQLDELISGLLVRGFLRVVDISDDGLVYTYAATIPRG